MIIKGVRKANRETILKFKNAGFNTDVFHNYLNITVPIKEKLTFDEVSFVVHQLKELVLKQDSIIESKDYEIKNLRSDIIDLRDRIHKLSKAVN